MQTGGGARRQWARHTRYVQYVLKDRRTYVHMYALPRVHNLLRMHSWYTHTYSMYVQEKLMRTHVRTTTFTMECYIVDSWLHMYVRMSTVLDYPFNCASQWPNQHNHSHYMLRSAYCTYVCTYTAALSWHNLRIRIHTYVQYICIQMYVRMPMQAHKCLPLPVLAWAGHAFSKETSYSCTTYLHA